MPGYLGTALLELQHDTPKQHHYAPSSYTTPAYGRKVQLTKIDTSASMTAAQTKRLERVVGKFLYCARALDDTLMHSLNDLATAKSEGTQATMEELTKVLNYAASNPNPTKLYRASDMILNVDSDAAYLVASKARSRAGGFHWLGNADGTLLNGSILVIAKILRMIVASATEAEIAALFLNARAAVPLRTTLIELGHPQPATPLKTDNLTACGIINRTVTQKRSKAIDMRFYWVCD
jgi:hypothetical protein